MGLCDPAPRPLASLAMPRSVLAQGLAVWLTSPAALSQLEEGEGEAQRHDDQAESELREG